MALVDSLLTAMVRADGDALVMHVGERPIVVAGPKTIDLSTHGMNLGAMVGMLGQLLPGDALASLKEFGAVEHALPARGDDRFSVVAARSGDDIWIEIRRRREAEAVEVVEPIAEPAAEPTAEGVTAAEPVADTEEPTTVAAAEERPAVAAVAELAEAATPEPLATEAPASVAEVSAAASDESASAGEPESPASVAEVSTAASDESASVAEPEAPAEPGALAAPEALAEPDPVVEEQAIVGSEPLVEPEAAAVVDVVVDPEPVITATSGDAPEIVMVAGEIVAVDEVVVAVVEEAAASDMPADAAASADGVETAVSGEEPAVQEKAEPELEPAAAAADSAPADEPQPVEYAASAEAPDLVEAVASTDSEAPVPEAVAPEDALVPAASSEPLEAATAVDDSLDTPSHVEAPAEAVLASARSSAYATSSLAPVVPMEPVRHAGPVAGGPPSRPATSYTPPSPPEMGPGQASPPPETPVTRTVRIEVPARASSRAAGLDRLLRAADGVGAAELFLVSQARPYVRVGGNVRPLAEESPLAAADIDALIGDVTPEPQRDAVRRGDPAEWLIELAEVGRVRCTTFRDLRGPGANFHFAFLRATTADELQLNADTRRLATEPDGLILVAGGAASDMSAIVAAFVDILNNQRADYIVTLEPQVRVLHVNREALISQREVGTDPARVATATRAALRETPDVLVIEGVTTGDVARLAIEAASQDRLVIASIDAPSAPEAVRRFIGLIPEAERAQARRALSHCFRGAVAQLLLRKVTGGKIAARELLGATRSAARLLADGDLAQLGSPDAGTAHTTMADTIVEFVRSGVVDVREAVRKAPDAETLVSRLNAAGVDLGALER